MASALGIGPGRRPRHRPHVLKLTRYAEELARVERLGQRSFTLGPLFTSSMPATASSVTTRTRSEAPYPCGCSHQSAARSGTFGENTCGGVTCLGKNLLWPQPPKDLVILSSRHVGAEGPEAFGVLVHLIFFHRESATTAPRSARPPWAADRHRGPDASMPARFATFPFKQPSWSHLP